MSVEEEVVDEASTPLSSLMEEVVVRITLLMTTSRCLLISTLHHKSDIGK